MIRIDSDTHFTPLDAFAGLDLKYAEQGPHVVALPTGRYRIDLPGARTVRASAHQTAARQTRSGLSSKTSLVLGSTAAEFFDLPVAGKELLRSSSPISSKVARASTWGNCQVEPAGY
jgi:hypothetical protein